MGLAEIIGASIGGGAGIQGVGVANQIPFFTTPDIIAGSPSLIRDPTTGGLSITQIAGAAASPVGFNFTGANITGIAASTVTPTININLGVTYTWAAGNLTNQSFIKITPPTIDFAAASQLLGITGTVEITDGPNLGANASLGVNAGLATLILRGQHSSVIPLYVVKSFSSSSVPHVGLINAGNRSASFFIDDGHVVHIGGYTAGTSLRLFTADTDALIIDSSQGATFQQGVNFLNNKLLTFGTTDPSSISSKVYGSGAKYSQITIPTTSNILVFATEAQKNFDYLNAAITSSNPVIGFTGGTANRNEMVIFQNDPGSRSFSMNAASGDDLNGTTRNASGYNFNLTAGNGGTLGGAAGSFSIGAGNGLSPLVSGGSLIGNAGHGGAADALSAGGTGGSWVIGAGNGGNGSAVQVAGDGGDVEIRAGVAGTDNGGGPGLNGDVKIGNASATNVYVSDTQFRTILKAGTSSTFLITDDASRDLFNALASGSPALTFGNAAANPTYSFLGSGVTAFSSSVGIGASPNAVTLLDLTSTTKGFRLPRMTTAQRTAITTTNLPGIVVYDTDIQAVFATNNAGVWVQLL